MLQMWTVLKVWLGLEKADDLAPWTHLKFGVIAGVACAIIALIWKGSTMAIVMVVGWVFIGALNEWLARRNARTSA